MKAIYALVDANNDGCIVARSAESKALGMPMGAPIHQWKDFCAEHGALSRVQITRSMAT